MPTEGDCSLYIGNSALYGLFRQSVHQINIKVLKNCRGSGNSGFGLI